MSACRLTLFVLFALGPFTLSNAKRASLVLLPDAAANGAVCLDGSPPGYYMRRGLASSKWILHLEGGGWCAPLEACVQRSTTALGSSKSWPPSSEFEGFLSDNPLRNPNFFDWNVVYIMYCDGASFSGNVDTPVTWNSTTTIYFRGWRVLNAVLESLLDAGMKEASEVILTGCSAGGLATYIHADYVGGFIPPQAKYRALSDAGYFLDIPTMYGNMSFEEGVKDLITLQNCTALNAECVEVYSGQDQWKCLFAPYTIQYIKTPVFILNSDYDTAQLAGIVDLPCLPPNCTAQQMKYFYEFRTQFLSALEPAIQSDSIGIFIDSCLQHCQTLTDNTWNDIRVNGSSMREAFEAWYKGKPLQYIDCAYPCNPTCPDVTMFPSNIKL